MLSNLTFPILPLLRGSRTYSSHRELLETFTRSQRSCTTAFASQERPERLVKNWHAITQVVVLNRPPTGDYEALSHAPFQPHDVAHVPNHLPNCERISTETLLTLNNNSVCSTTVLYVIAGFHGTAIRCIDTSGTVFRFWELPACLR